MSWLMMTREPVQAGNRAGKTVRCPQWWESEPEWWAVTSGVGSPVRLPAFLLFARLFVARLVSRCRLSTLARASQVSAIHGGQPWLIPSRPFGYDQV